MKPGAKRNNHYQPKYPTEYTLPDNIYIAAFYAARHTFNCILADGGKGSNQQIILKLNQSFGKRGNLSDLRYLTVYMLRYIMDEMDSIEESDSAVKYEEPGAKKDMTAVLAVNHASKMTLKKACRDAFSATGLDDTAVLKMQDHICGTQYREFSEYEEYRFRKAWPICIFQAAKNLGYILDAGEGKYLLSDAPFIRACTEAFDALPGALTEPIKDFILRCEVDAETGQLFFEGNDDFEAPFSLSSFSKIYLWHVAKHLGFV